MNLLVCCDCWSNKREARLVAKACRDPLILWGIAFSYMAPKGEDMVIHRAREGPWDDHVTIFACGDRYSSQVVQEATRAVLHVWRGNLDTLRSPGGPHPKGGQ